MRSAPSWSPPEQPTLVVVPHPDDESLMTGGLIARLAGRNVPITLLAVTDGGAAYAGAAIRDLGHVRRNEQRAAVEALGVTTTGIWRLGLPDGGVPARQRELAGIIERLIDDRGITSVVAPWRHDVHSDHEACGRAAADGAARSGATVVGGLFWAPRKRALHDGPMHGLVELRLTDHERAAKRAAIDHHRSQIDGFDGAVEPILSADDVAAAGSPSEFYVVES